MRILPLLPLVMLSGCAGIDHLLQPSSAGERSSAFTYVPIDPFTVSMGLGGANCPSIDDFDEMEEAELIRVLAGVDENHIGYRFVDLPEAFPDNHVRIAYKSFNSSGDVSYGPISSTAANDRYQIVIDYINADVINQAFYVLKEACDSNGTCTPVSLYNDADSARRPSSISDTGTESFRVTSHRYSIAPVLDQSFCDELQIVDAQECRNAILQEQWFRSERLAHTAHDLEDLNTVNVPIYVGVGLRVIADVVAIESGASLSGLDLIAASAEMGQVSGSLTVQTIGLNGESISAALPIQSELNRTTVQNAIASLGAIKALMYDADVERQPRIVGIYNPIGGDENVINTIVSHLSASAPLWDRPCTITATAPKQY